MQRYTPPSSFTSQLYSTSDCALRKATEHPFLEHAGKGTLPLTSLCGWLVQDKYYQLAYVNFIGGLLAKLPLALCAFRHSDEQSLPWTTLDLLVGALNNIHEEIKFYKKVIDKYRLPLEEAPPNEITTRYIELFEEVSAKDAPLFHGLVVLWGTEKCYLDAWTYALSQTSIADQTILSTGLKSSAIGALHNEFIPNWTSQQFRNFVNNLASSTDMWAEKADSGVVESSKELWSRLLELEARFWPEKNRFTF